MFQTQKKKEQGTLDVAISGKIKINSVDHNFRHLNIGSQVMLSKNVNNKKNLYSSMKKMEKALLDFLN